MAWQEPKTNWTDKDVVKPSDLNRIEGNIAELKKAATIDIADTAGNFAANNVEDALQELAGNVKNGKTSIANAIVAMGQSASGNDTFDTLAAKIRDISKDATAGTGDVLSGKTFYAGGAKKTGTMPNRGAVVITPGTQNQAIPQGYHNGQGYVKGDANLKPVNIRAGISIFGVTGNYRLQISGSTSDSNIIYDNAIEKVVPYNSTPQLLISFRFYEVGSYVLKLIFASRSGYSNFHGRFQIFLNNNLIQDTGENWGGNFPISLKTPVFTISSTNDVIYIYGRRRSELNVVVISNLQILGNIDNLLNITLH